MKTLKINRLNEEYIDGQEFDVYFGSLRKPILQRCFLHK